VQSETKTLSFGFIFLVKLKGNQAKLGFRVFF